MLNFASISFSVENMRINYHGAHRVELYIDALRAKQNFRFIGDERVRINKESFVTIYLTP